MLLAGINDKRDPAERQAEQKQHDKKNETSLVESRGRGLNVFVALRAMHISSPICLVVFPDVRRLVHLTFTDYASTRSIVNRLLRDAACGLHRRWEVTRERKKDGNGGKTTAGRCDANADTARGWWMESENREK